MTRRLYRLLLIAAGWFSLALGVIGIVVPLMPTTVFVLAAAFCFARSSERFHLWLMQHRLFGPMVRNYQSGQGLPRRVRRRAVMVMWATMALSVWIVGTWWSAALLVPIGLAVTVYLYRLPSYD